jgi:hypothetical protein
MSAVEAATKQRLVKIMTENTSLCRHDFFKSSINPITNPNSVYSHAQSRDNIVNLNSSQQFDD